MTAQQKLNWKSMADVYFHSTKKTERIEWSPPIIWTRRPHNSQRLKQKNWSLVIMTRGMWRVWKIGGPVCKSTLVSFSRTKTMKILDPIFLSLLIFKVLLRYSHVLSSIRHSMMKIYSFICPEDSALWCLSGALLHISCPKRFWNYEALSRLFGSGAQETGNMS